MATVSKNEIVMMSGHDEFAGALRERVTFLEAIDVPDSYGGSNRLWAAMDSVWAHVDLFDVQEHLVAGRIKQRENYKIICRTGKIIDPAWRLEWQGRLMSIIAVSSNPLLPDRLTITAVQEREQ
jgi:SPP1 family predicted phage head-tail adaptor